MNTKALRCEDYLEWLKNEEEYLLWSIELAEDTGDCATVVEAGETLQIIRELKDIVAKYEGKDE